MYSSIPGNPTEPPWAILMDGLFQSFLLGTIVNQAFKYWLDSRNDSWHKRIFVTTIILLSILQTILEDYKVWRTTISRLPWSTSPMEWSDLFLNGCICALCEAFYIRRCWKMSNKSVWVLAPLAILATLIMAANLYLAIAMGLAFHSLGATNDTLMASHFLLPSTIVAFSFWIFGSLVLEASVTIILMISLWNSRTGLKEVDKTVLRVIHITCASAVLPTICMVIAVGLYHAAPRMGDHLVLFFVLMTGKFYTFGMLRTLNSRAKLRRRMQSHSLGRTSLTGWNRDQAAGKHVSVRAKSPSMSLGSAINTGLGEVASREEEDVTVQEFNNNLHFASSIQSNTPVIDAQERGIFRNRVISHHGDGSELFN